MTEKRESSFKATRRVIACLPLAEFKLAQKELDRAEKALRSIAYRDFGGYSLSVDEAEMRDDARRGLGEGE